MYQIILASGSPRRREIMDTMGIPYKVMSSNVEEFVAETEPTKMVQALAALKTEDISKRLAAEEDDKSYIIIGADTMVFYQDQALGKPKDEEDAIRMLQMLSGQTHEVYTGVSIIIMDGSQECKKLSFAVGTRVVVQALFYEQILDYVKSKEPMDKAGAYGIQGSFGIHIKEIHGDYYNVVGFPIAKIYETLLAKGINIKKLN